MTSLALDNVSMAYAGTAVLQGVDLTFPESAITAVIGPSGCGKSTLLRLCMGLERPDQGSIRLFGENLDYTRLPTLRRRIGYAVQGTGLFPHLTADANIRLMAKLEGWPETAIEARITELLTLSQLESTQLARYPHELSGGQQQRVGLCRALMLRPDVLLLDEPFAAIDPITRAGIHTQLLAMQSAEPRTVVLVTHDMQEALRVADHLVVMQAGHIVHREATQALEGRAGTEGPDALLLSLLQEETA